MKALLIGDSNLQNCEKYVCKYLGDEIQLLPSVGNCETSKNVRENIQRWMPQNGVDLIHINCGLHDIRYNPGVDSPMSTLQQYKDNLDYIFQLLSSCGATVIWATSTPIDEKIHNAVKVSRRYYSDVVDYNSASVKLANKFGFEVNDLFDKISKLGLYNVLRSDGVHFNEQGYAKMGECIADSIKRVSIT